ncbi:MAG: Hsp20/alpha crystallin family protein [Cytophagaceae bacterium]|nr:Hsp20/alpha crystallin family protein [Cytophagaceae bacterium]
MRLFNRNLLANKKILKSLLGEVNLFNTIYGGTVQTAVEITNSSKGIIISLHTPTVAMESYNILVTNANLIVSIFAKEHRAVDDYKPIESPVFMQSFDIPPFVNTEKIEAIFKKNILTIILPVKTISDNYPKFITIKKIDE